jgi:hypothetical protein
MPGFSWFGRLIISLFTWLITLSASCHGFKKSTISAKFVTSHVIRWYEYLFCFSMFGNVMKNKLENTFHLII